MENRDEPQNSDGAQFPERPEGHDGARDHDRARDHDTARWLSSEESSTWLSVWTMTVWLPTRLDAQLRKDAGLSLVEYHSLSQIDMSPERTLRLSELAAVTNMTLSHLSRVVSRLEDADLLRREPDPMDGRYTRAILTDAGHDRVVAAAPGHVEAVRKYVFDGLSEVQKEALGDTVGPIVEALVPTRIARSV